MSVLQPRSQAESDPVVATRLLELGVASDCRPVDELITRLERPDGPSWFACIMQSDLLRQLGDGAAPVPLSELKHSKDRCKKKLAEPCSHVERLQALLGYFLCLAGALHWHRELICSRSETEVRSVLADLATVAPIQWQSVLAKASLPGQ